MNARGHNELHWRNMKEKGISPDLIYFFRAGDFIKIGRTNGHPSWRVSQLQTGCPYPIEIMGYIHAGPEREAKLHKQFSHLRTCGEWFRAERELLICIEALFDSNRDRLVSECNLMRELRDLKREVTAMLEKEASDLRNTMEALSYE